MKKSLLTLAILGCFLNSVAQDESENKRDKKVETFTTEITTKSTKVDTKVTTEVKTETDVISLKNKGDKRDMSVERSTETSHSKNVMSNNDQTNKANDADIERLKQKQKAELEASIKAGFEDAAKQKQEMEIKEKQRLAELEAKRQSLEKRSKGMTKLKKDN